jgi:hypothetical protein
MLRSTKDLEDYAIHTTDGTIGDVKPANAYVVADALCTHFANRGGRDCLYCLFPDGPVTQGSRIAAIPVPAYSEDILFGTEFWRNEEFGCTSKWFALYSNYTNQAAGHVMRSICKRFGWGIAKTQCAVVYTALSHTYCNVFNSFLS